MKIRLSHLCCLVFLFCFISSDLSAAVWHIKPTTEVPIRTGQGTDYKIITVVSDGTEVALLEMDGDWVRIQLDNGKEGWTLKRYLSDEKPLQAQVMELEQNKTQLEAKLAETDTRLTELMQLHSQTEQDLTGCVAERGNITDNYQRLQQDTADVVQTKEKLAATEEQFSELSGRLTDLQLENARLKKNSSLIWFLAGSGVLLSGLLIGFLSGKRNKKRRSSLL